MSDRFREAVEGAWQRIEERQWIYGRMGRVNPDATYTFDVPGRPEFVYVTIRNAAGAQTSVPARNDANMPHAPNLSVKMKLEYGVYVIHGKSGRRDLGIINPPSPPTGVEPHDHDDLYFRETEHINVSVGAADAGKPIKLNASGEVDPSMLGASIIEAAQDAVGAMLLDSSTIDFTYDDATPSLTAIVIDNSITFAKMQDIVTDSLVGRDTAGTGDPENITLNATLSMTGSGVLQRAALTGDVTAAAGDNATLIANDVVTNAKLANMAANTVKANVTGSAADPSDVGASAFLHQYIDASASATMPFDGAEKFPFTFGGSLKHIAWTDFWNGLSDDFVTLGTYQVIMAVKDFNAGVNSPHVRALTTSGLYFANSLDQVAVLIDHDRNVGIGTITPQVLTHLVSSAVAGATYNAGDPLTIERNASSNINIITGTANNGGVIFSDADARARGAFFYSHADDALIYWTAGTEKARITSVGNVGIGTTVPGVDVIGTIDITATPILQVDGTQPRMVLRGSTDVSINFIDTGAGANAKWIRFFTDGGFSKFQSISDAGALQADNILVLNHSTGQVGINTATLLSGKELTVNGDADISGEMSAGWMESSSWQSLGFGHHFYSDGGSPELMVLAENGRLGLNAATVPADFIHVEGTDVGLRLGGADDYYRARFVSAAQSLIEVARASGDILLDTNLHPADGTGICTVRFFRVTNTTGLVRLQVYKGDGTNTPNHNLAGNSNSYINGNNGNVGVGHTGTPAAKLDVGQLSTTAAIPVIELEQADLSEAFINFVSTTAAGNALQAVGALVFTPTHYIRIWINGTPRYMRAGTIA